MNIGLRTIFYCIQSILGDIQRLEENRSQNSIPEDELHILDLENALLELERAYTDYIKKSNITNYPSYEKLYSTIVRS